MLEENELSSSKYWYEMSDSPKAVENLYRGRPNLETVSVASVTFSSCNSRLRLEINLPEFPAHPPTRWIAQEANAIGAEIDLFGISELEIFGLSSKNEGRCKVEPFPDPCRFRFQIAGEHFRISAMCQAFLIQRFLPLCVSTEMEEDC